MGGWANERWETQSTHWEIPAFAIHGSATALVRERIGKTCGRDALFEAEMQTRLWGAKRKRCSDEERITQSCRRGKRDHV